MTDARPHVAVIGGGISGLVAAYELARPRWQAAAGHERAPRVTLLEADTRLGGKLRTESFAGRDVDAGAEALLTRVPDVRELCAELGLSGALVAPATVQAHIWTAGKLRPLPTGMLAGLPGGVRSVTSTGILSQRAILRAALDLVLPSRAPELDVSIGTLVRRRLGSEVLERLLDPLLGGIHAGSCDELSAHASAPQLVAALARGHGLIRGLRELAAAGGAGPGAGESGRAARGAGRAAGGADAPAPPAQPALVGVRGGLGTLVGALMRELAGAEVRTGERVRALEPAEAGRIRLERERGAPLLADAVVLAVPAPSAAELLRGACPEAARELSMIEYASVGTVLLAYPPDAVPGRLPGSGFLVPQRDGRLLSACTCVSAKWPVPGESRVVLKASVGHAGDERALALEDQQLCAAVDRELHAALGLRTPPCETRVTRFERALAQYRVGHIGRVERIEHALRALPRVRVTGAAYRGVGVAACVGDARRVARQLSAALS